MKVVVSDFQTGFVEFAGSAEADSNLKEILSSDGTLDLRLPVIPNKAI